MSRKIAGAVVALAVVLSAVWWFGLRHRDGEAAKPPAPSRNALIDVKPAPAGKAEVTPPRGFAPNWSLDTDPDGPLRLEGQVVGPDNAPVGDADVMLSSVPPKHVKTEADGSFAFDKLVGRTYHISAQTAKLTGAMTYKLTQKSDPVVIHVGEGAAVAVHVIDEQKQPIADAEVKGDEREDAAVKTDAKGDARVAPVQPGWATVEVSAPGYAKSTAFTTVGSAGATAEVTVTLKKGVAVAGRVIDEHGKPIAKARVTSSEAAAWGFGGSDSAESNAKGEFSFAAIAPGNVLFHATDGEHAPAQSAIVPVKTRSVTGVEITMKAGGVASGVVLDSDGQPVPYATVRMIHADTGRRGMMGFGAARKATTDQTGKFELRGLPRTKLNARAESDTAASQISAVDLTSQQTVKDLKIVLDVKGTISGTVVDDTNQPVAEVSVNAFPDILGGASTDGLALAGMSSATTDGAGHFTIRGLPDGAYRLWAARAVSQDFGFGHQNTPAKSGDTNVRLVLAAPGGIKGTIELEAGGPPKTALVQIGQRPTVPAAGGAFEVKELEPGKYDLKVRGPEFAETVQHDVEVKPGKTTDLGALKVLRGRRLVGRVVDTSGNGVGGVTVKLAEMLISLDSADTDRSAQFDSLTGVRTAVTDNDGSFALIGVPKKQTSVMADDPDRGRSIATNVPEGTDDPPPVTLALVGFGSITGKVTLKGQPQANLTITDSLKGGAMQAAFAQTGEDGTFVLAKEPEGTHVLQAMQQGMMSMKATTVTVQVTAGKTTQVAIDIPVGSVALAVDVRALPNNEVDSAQVFLFNGTVAFTNAKQLTAGFLQGGAQGMKLWFGAGNPPPEFDELVPGGYTACTIPITGKLSDPQFQQQLQANMNALKVYCAAVTVAPTPATQTFVQQVPAMTPLPNPQH